MSCKGARAQPGSINDCTVSVDGALFISLHERQMTNAVLGVSQRAARIEGRL